MPPSVQRTSPGGSSTALRTVPETGPQFDDDPTAGAAAAGGFSSKGRRKNPVSPSPERHQTVQTSNSNAEQEEISGNTLPSSNPSFTSSAQSSSLYGSHPFSPNTMNMYGAGGGAMYNSMYGMMGSPMMGGGGPLSGLNQFLFSVQTVLFSLGQAVQIVGMNTQAFQQLLDAATTMLDHALTTWKDMRALERQALEDESEHDKKRKRRLRALRWAILVGGAYTAYRFVVRRMVSRARRMKRQRQLMIGNDIGNSGGWTGGGYDNRAIQSAPPPTGYGSYNVVGNHSPAWNSAPYHHGSYGYGHGPNMGGGMNPYGGTGYY